MHLVNEGYGEERKENSKSRSDVFVTISIEYI
jgi:hypothetical protein